jgi:hypothetical protein
MQVRLAVLEKQRECAARQSRVMGEPGSHVRKIMDLLRVHAVCVQCCYFTTYRVALASVMPDNSVLLRRLVACPVCRVSLVCTDINHTRLEVTNGVVRWLQLSVLCCCLLGCVCSSCCSAPCPSLSCCAMPCPAVPCCAALCYVRSVRRPPSMRSAGWRHFWVGAFSLCSRARPFVCLKLHVQCQLVMLSPTMWATVAICCIPASTCRARLVAQHFQHQRCFVCVLVHNSLVSNAGLHCRWICDAGGGAS